MAPIVTSVQIARPPEDVFAYLSDLNRHPEWQESLQSVTVESEGPVGVGTRVTHHRKLGPRTVATASEITAYDPPHRIAFRGLDGPIRATGSQRIEAGGDGSRVDFEMELEGYGLGKLMLPMARRQAARQVVSDHERAKQILESGRG
jgi:uncharacterized membrane protein